MSLPLFLIDNLYSLTEEHKIEWRIVKYNISGITDENVTSLSPLIQSKVLENCYYYLQLNCHDSLKPELSFSLLCYNKQEVSFVMRVRLIDIHGNQIHYYNINDNHRDSYNYRDEEFHPINTSSSINLSEAPNRNKSIKQRLITGEPIYAFIQFKVRHQRPYVQSRPVQRPLKSIKYLYDLKFSDGTELKSTDCRPLFNEYPEIIDIWRKSKDGPIELNLSSVQFDSLLVSDFPEDPKEIVPLLKLADEYGLPKLEWKCWTQLWKSIKDSNAKEILEIAKDYKQKELKDLVKIYLRELAPIANSED